MPVCEDIGENTATENIDVAVCLLMLLPSMKLYTKAALPEKLRFDQKFCMMIPSFCLNDDELSFLGERHQYYHKSCPLAQEIHTA